MHVFLVRHAEAVDESLTLRDPSRHLTARGRVQARDLGIRLRWHDCHPTQLWASPLVRAVQTAELVLAGLGSDQPLEVIPALAPDGSAREVVALLRGLRDATDVVLVGHEPSLSAIGALLSGRRDFPALGKAEATRLDDGAPRWRFAWDAVAPSRP